MATWTGVDNIVFIANDNLLGVYDLIGNKELIKPTFKEINYYKYNDIGVSGFASNATFFELNATQNKIVNKFPIQDNSFEYELVDPEDGMSQVLNLSTDPTNLKSEIFFYETSEGKGYDSLMFFNRSCFVLNYNTYEEPKVRITEPPTDEFGMDWPDMDYDSGNLLDYYYDINDPTIRIPKYDTISGVTGTQFAMVFNIEANSFSEIEYKYLTKYSAINCDNSIEYINFSGKTLDNKPVLLLYNFSETNYFDHLTNENNKNLEIENVSSTYPDYYIAYTNDFQNPYYHNYYSKGHSTEGYLHSYEYPEMFSLGMLIQTVKNGKMIYFYTINSYYKDSNGNCYFDEITIDAKPFVNNDMQTPVDPTTKVTLVKDGKETITTIEDVFKATNK